MRVLAIVISLAQLPLAAYAAPPVPVDYTVELDAPLVHDDGTFLWFHPRVAPIPTRGPNAVVMTLQKHLQVSDFYGPLHAMHTDDLGEHWRGPEGPAALEWTKETGDITVGVCDVTPGWHPQTEKIIATGIKVRYQDGAQRYDKPRSHDVAYTVYAPDLNTWTPWRMVADLPEAEGKFFLVGNGCGQWLVKSDGTLLLPVYYAPKAEVPFSSTVLHCSFDGDRLRYLAHGAELQLADERGFVEPSIAYHQGRYYLTLRNDLRGYVATSIDGLAYDKPIPWTFDDGSELGSYNTQQHWLTHDEGLFLIYTRRGADNDHVFRHRAPLFMAQVDPVRLCVIRATERILMPDRGATLGNFGATAINANESWVTDAEGIFSDKERQRGAKGATWVARIQWAKPNTSWATLPQ